MRQDQPSNLRLVVLAIDAAVMSITFLAVTWLRANLHRFYSFDLIPGDALLQEVSLGAHAVLVVVVVPVLLVSMDRAGTYKSLRRTRSDVLLLRITRAVVLGMLLVLGLLFAVQVTAYLSRTLVVGFTLSVIGTLFAGRLALRMYLRHRRPVANPWRILVVGDPSEAAGLLQTLVQHADWGMRVIGVVPPHGIRLPADGIPVLGTLDDIDRLLVDHPIDQVFMTGRAWPQATLRRVADACEEVGIRLSMDANFLGLSIARAELDDIEGWSVLSFSSGPTHMGALTLKRAMDVGVSITLLILLGPLMVLIGLVIRLEDRGPMMFTQIRTGLHGRMFPMYKFRSMVIDAETRRDEIDHLNEVPGPVFKSRRDPRVTRVGTWLRRTSLDELPQLVNVLRGEMSLVGPRPPLPDEVTQYARWQMRRLSMKPGLTCIWQVSGRSNVDFDTWMALDLQYIDNWSLFLDLKLLAKTVPAVLSGAGAR